MLNDNLIRARKAKGLTQEQIANEAGVSRQMYTDYERLGRIPRISIALKIADALDVIDLREIWESRDG